jgi:hypothetical protein
MRSQTKTKKSAVATHKHKCHCCGNVWEHADSMAGDEYAHTCECGKVVWKRWYGAACEAVEYCCDAGNCLMKMLEALYRASIRG